jgi:hypothetical protein
VSIRANSNAGQEVVYVDPAGVISPEAAREYPILVRSTGTLHGPALITCHADRNSLNEWALSCAEGAAIRQTLAVLDSVKSARESQSIELERIQKAIVDHTRLGMERFAEALEPGCSRDEVETRSMSARSHLEPSIFDPILFYDKPFETSPPTGAPENSSTLPLPTGSWPSLGWFGWDNRPRSARVFGGAWLFENDWFGGRSAYIMGYNGLIPLAPLFFDQTVSSVQVF